MPPTLTVQIAFATNPLDTPTWTDVTAYVLEIPQTRRGRQYELDRIEAGTASLVLDNADRRFDPTYTASPYYPNVLPMRRIRVSAVWDSTTYYLYDGFIESWPLAWEGGLNSTVAVPCVDAFGIFALDSRDISRSQELSSVRVAAVLDLAGWPAADRDIETGQSNVQAASLTRTAVLQHLLSVAEAENGLVFLDGRGYVIFHDRHYRLMNSAASACTFGFGTGELPYIELRPEYDNTLIYNDISFTRSGGTEQTATDSASQTAYGKRTLTKTGLLITSDSEADSAAEYNLARYKQPSLRFSSIVVDGYSTDDLWPYILGLKIGDRVTVKKDPPGGVETIEQDCYIEAIEHRITPTSWRCSYQLSPASTQSYWMLGITNLSELGETTILGY